MRILTVNWLDLANPQAGGAELHFFEIFSRLAARGHAVTLVTSGWPGAAPREHVEGLDVRRFGGRYTFALRARGAVRRALNESAYDLVVEDINKLPLFLPTCTRLPVYVVVPHLFGTTAFREAPFPIAAAVWAAELPVPAVYRHCAFHAISESTRDDLVRRGVDPAAIRVIYPGVDAAALTPDPATPRAERPTFLYLGRLKRYKGLDVALRAVAIARRLVPDIRLDIAGRGDDRARLERLRARLDLGDAVRFRGFVTNEEKRTLLRRAWAVVFPSPKEGWGLTNVEAAACGTPAIASDSPGLRESVRDGQTGVLVPHGDADALAGVLVRFSTEPRVVQILGEGARRFAETLSWDRAAVETERHLLDTMSHFSERSKGQR